MATVLFLFYFLAYVDSWIRIRNTDSASCELRRNGSASNFSFFLPEAESAKASSAGSSDVKPVEQKMVSRGTVPFLYEMLGLGASMLRTKGCLMSSRFLGIIFLPCVVLLSI